MSEKKRDVPETVYSAASQTWRRWHGKVDSARPAGPGPGTPERRRRDASAGDLSYREQMVAKIRRRMAEYPEWYETRPEPLAKIVCTELDRIGASLAGGLPASGEPLDVWQIPLSVFNWLDGDGDTFVRGALCAWPRAETFNEANSARFSEVEKEKMRKPFLDIAPPLLRVVLREISHEDLRISFAERFVGPELKFLVMRVQGTGGPARRD